MSKLTNKKKEEYKKKLKQQYPDLGEDALEKIIEYIYSIAILESEILK